MSLKPGCPLAIRVGLTRIPNDFASMVPSVFPLFCSSRAFPSPTVFSIRQLTVLLQRKLGMSINKVGSEIVVAELEMDGAAAACGLLSIGDALEEASSIWRGPDLNISPRAS